MNLPLDPASPGGPRSPCGPDGPLGPGGPVYRRITNIEKQII